MRRMVVQRSDLYDVGQRRRARLGTRSDISYETKAATRRCGGFCVARFVQPGAVLRRLSYLFGTPSRSLPLFRRVLLDFPFTALPTGRAAHQSAKQRAASIRPFRGLPRGICRKRIAHTPRESH